MIRRLAAAGFLAPRNGIAIALLILAASCASTATTTRMSTTTERRPTRHDVDRVLFEVIKRASGLEAPCPDKNGRLSICLVVLEQPAGGTKLRIARIGPGLQALLQPLPLTYAIGEQCRSELDVQLTVGPADWSSADHVTVRANMMLAGVQGTSAAYELTRESDGKSWHVKGAITGFYN